MKISEIETIKPKTPDQLRVDSLKKQKDKAADALKAERDRQKLQKAREKLQKARNATMTS